MKKHNKDSRKTPISRDSTTDKIPPDADAVPAIEGSGGVQGEGNYVAARAFNDAERRFVASGKVPAAARAAAPGSEAERREMLEAEQAGKARAAGKGTAPHPSAKDVGRNSG
jgi:hypothetical protein